MTAFIVAEAGVNHLGERKKMLALCDAAKEAGADAVKFQAYDTRALVERRGITDPDTIGLLTVAELADTDLEAIAAHCRKIGLKWFCSVFDPTQVRRVLGFGACALKIGHKESDWAELVDQCWRYQVPAYASFPPTFNPESAGTGVKPVLCVAEYPAKSKPQLWQVIGGQDQCWGNESIGFAGFSSHYTDWRIPAAAALRGAEYIEAHLKLSKNDPEAAWSLNVGEFAAMVRQIREYESWL